MGKWLYFMLVLVMIELMFFTLVDTVAVSLTSFIFLAIKAISTGGSWDSIIGLFTLPLIKSFVALAAISGAMAGTFITPLSSGFKFPEIIWGTIAINFLLSIGADMVYIYSKLNSAVPGRIGSLIALFIMAPMIILFSLIVIEWVRGKD